MKCPNCNNEMVKGYVYVRGFGSCLFWGTDKDVRFWLRKGLKMIHLQKSSCTASKNQGVIEADNCVNCGKICFEAKYV